MTAPNHPRDYTYKPKMVDLDEIVADIAVSSAAALDIAA